LKGWRKKAQDFIKWVYGAGVTSIAGGVINDIHLDYNYSYYLGPNYKNSQRKILKPSTIVCNHISQLDNSALLARY
jgi:hypothetical protein